MADTAVGSASNPPQEQPTNSTPQQPSTNDAPQQQSVNSAAQQQPSTNVVSQQPSAFSQLNALERYWSWKAGLRAVVCLIDLVGIGCAAYLIAYRSAADIARYIYYFNIRYAGGGALLVFCVSFLWCLIWILIPICLRPRRPLTPGLAVGVDLVLWLAFIVVGMITVVAILSLTESDFDPNYYTESSSYRRDYSGEYYLAANDTWVYNITNPVPGQSWYHFNETIGGYQSSIIESTDGLRNCTPPFSSCAEQDASVNKFWHDLPRLEALEIVVNTVQWLAVLLHFTLFVWACVDTHRYNQRHKRSKEQVVADRIIADLQRRGLLNVQNNPAGHVIPMTQMQKTEPAPVTSGGIQEFYTPATYR